MPKKTVLNDPITTDKETVKKYDITPEDEIPAVAKLSFLRDQLMEIKGMQWRARVDIMHATRLTESDNDTLKQKGHQNLSQHINEVQQSTGAIRMLRKLIEQLIEENPGLQPKTD